MKKVLLVAATVIALSGCSTIQKYWPRDHDPVMFDHLVTLEVKLDAVDCKNPQWYGVVYNAEVLDRYTTWREDPQAENMQGLSKHIKKLSTSINPTFCELGKKTAKQRINAAMSAWKGR